MDERTVIEALFENKEPSPIDGFLLRLAEGLRRLSYKERSKIKIEFLKRLHEVEKAEAVRNWKMLKKVCKRFIHLEDKDIKTVF